MKTGKLKSKLKKIPAYTLTEILVVLALTAIVAALSFSALGFIKRALGLIETNYEFANSYRNLEIKLSLDFANAESINSISPNKLELTGPLETTTYAITDTHLIRNNDTLVTGRLSFQLFSNGEEISTGACDAIKLGFGEIEKEVIMFISKPITTKDRLDQLGN